MSVLIIALASANLCDEHKAHYQEKCCSQTSQCYIHMMNSPYTSRALNQIENCGSNLTCFTSKSTVNKFLIVKILSSAHFSSNCDSLVSNETYDGIKNSILSDLNQPYVRSDFIPNPMLLSDVNTFASEFYHASFQNKLSMVQYLSYHIHAGGDVFTQYTKAFKHGVQDYFTSHLMWGEALTNEIASGRNFDFYTLMLSIRGTV